jgi:hypothetical protein
MEVSMKNQSLPIALDSKAMLFTFTLVSFLAFTLPFSLGHPQLLVGTIVNACLFISALFLPKKFIYPLIFFPSLGVLCRGIIFGPLTSFLILMLPFIWLGNWLLVFGFRRLFRMIKSGVLAVLGASVLKAGFLFFCAFVFVKLKILPQVFLTSMGAIQLMTALLGGATVLLIKQSLKYTKHA